MVLTVNEWYCITLYTSAGGRLSGLQDEQGLLFRGRAGQMFRESWPVRGANAHGAERCIAVVQFSLLSHLIHCMISQQMEATANYLLLLKKKKKTRKNTCCVVMASWFFYHFPPLGCCFCQLELRLMFSNGALCENASSVQWRVEFYAWKLCTKKTSKHPNAWFGVLFWRATLCWKAGHRDDPQNLQRQQGLLLACAVDSAVCYYCFFGFFLPPGFVCFKASVGQRTVIKDVYSSKLPNTT